MFFLKVKARWSQKQQQKQQFRAIEIDPGGAPQCPQFLDFFNDM
jgi:hypothetical protein